MSLDFLNESRLLPAINRDLVKQKGQDEIVDYLVRLVHVLQEDLIRTFMQLINNQLHLMNVGCFNFSLPDVNGVYADGSWRFILTGGNIELQKKISGTWTKQALWSE